MNFKVGDIVEAFGVKGEVMVIDDGGGDYPIRVLFVTGDTDFFRQDGRLNVWHEAPSLKLIKRSKKYKEVTIETFGNIYNVIYNDPKRIYCYKTAIEALSTQLPQCINRDNKLIKVTYLVEDKE